MEKISVLLAVHNGEKYIKDSILSVLNQTYPHFELLICANGCTDNTISKIGEILFEHPDRDKIYLTSLPNASKCEALNYLLKLSPRNFIAIQDADDIWHPTKLEEQIKYIDSYDIIGTFCNYIDETGKTLEINNPIPTHNDMVRKSIKEHGINPIINCSVLINKRFLKAFNGYDSYYEGVEDFYLWTQIAIWSMAKFINIDKKLVSHRLHSQSNFNSKNLGDKLNKISEYLKENINEKQIIE